MAYDVNNDLMRGDDMFLYITSGSTKEVLAFATNAQLQVAGESISTQNKMSCRWQQSLQGGKSYTISADALYTQKQQAGFSTYDKLMSIMLDNGVVDWYMGPATSASTSGACSANTFVLDETQIYYSGEAVITSLDLNAGNNEVASYSASFTGNGAVEQHNFTTA